MKNFHLAIVKNNTLSIYIRNFKNILRLLVKMTLNPNYKLMLLTVPGIV